MSRFACEWDPRKASRNRRKHGVSFEEASTVFDDPLVLLLLDEEHGETRIIAIGSSNTGRVLLVVSVDVKTDMVRIISARKATKAERRLYEEGE